MYVHMAGAQTSSTCPDIKFITNNISAKSRSASLQDTGTKE